MLTSSLTFPCFILALGKWQVLPVPPSHLCKIMAVFRTNNPVFSIAFMQKSVYQKHNLKRMIQGWSRSWPEKIAQVPTPLALTGVAIDDTFLIAGLTLHFRHYLSFVIFLNCQIHKALFWLHIDKLPPAKFLWRPIMLMWIRIADNC